MQLKNNQVHIWKIQYDSALKLEICSAKTLSKEEVNRAKRFKQPEIGKTWAFFHSAMREILSRYVGFSATDIEFALDNRQKPYLKNTTDTPFYFNLSHSGNFAMLAVTKLAPVGVDIEVSKQIQDADSVARRFFSKRENTQLRKISQGKFMQHFYQIWTAKEAVIKANGWGMSAALDSFDVLVERSLEWFSPSLRNLLADTGVYWVRQLSPESDYPSLDLSEPDYSMPVYYAAVCLNITDPSVIDYFDINQVTLKEMIFENNNL